MAAVCCEEGEAEVTGAYIEAHDMYRKAERMYFPILSKVVFCANHLINISSHNLGNRKSQWR